MHNGLQETQRAEEVMADKPNWFRGAVNDLFDGKPSERKTGFFEDMLDGGGYANRGETGGLIGFMERMFGGDKPSAPQGRPKMAVSMQVTDKPNAPMGRPKIEAAPYYDGMGMGTQAGGQTEYFDGMGMDYGAGRPDQGSGMTPANAYVPPTQPMQYGGRGNVGMTMGAQTPPQQMPASPSQMQAGMPPGATYDQIIQYLRSVGAM